MLSRYITYTKGKLRDRHSVRQMDGWAVAIRHGVILEVCEVRIQNSRAVLE